MKRYRLKLILVMLFLTLFLSGYVLISSEPNMGSEITSTADTEVQSEIPKVDQKAVDLLRCSLDYLSSLTKFSLHTQSTYEDVLDSGHRIDLEVSSSVVVSRPDKLRTERHGDQINQIFYYDGKTLTLYNPLANVYATESVPATIEEMLHFARDIFGLGTPVSDLIYNNSFSLLMNEVSFAVVIGKEMIGEVQCNHMLFSRPGADFQIWIAVDGPPLPLKYVVTDTATPELLSFVIVMQDWDVAPTLTESLFSFVPSQETKKISFIKAE